MGLAFRRLGARSELVSATRSSYAQLLGRGFARRAKSQPCEPTGTRASRAIMRIMKRFGSRTKMHADLSIPCQTALVQNEWVPSASHPMHSYPSGLLLFQASRPNPYSKNFCIPRCCADFEEKASSVLPKVINVSAVVCKQLGWDTAQGLQNVCAQSKLANTCYGRQNWASAQEVGRRFTPRGEVTPYI